MNKINLQNKKWDRKEIEFWKQISKGELDDIDVMIYLALRENGRLPDTELARIVGVSTPTARRRRLHYKKKAIFKLLVF